jgi:signal peptidase I
MTAGWARLAGRVVTVMALTAVLTLTGWTVLPLLWGWQPYTITSGSMEPLMRAGDVVVVAPIKGAPAVGSVVTISPASPGAAPVTHRIVEKLPDGRFRTRGDANPGPDGRLVDSGEIVGGGRVVVPLAGLVRLHAGRLVPAAAGVALIALVLARRRGIARGRGRATTAVLSLVALTGTAAVVARDSNALFTAVSKTVANSWRTPYFYATAIKASGPLSYWRLGQSSTTSAPDETGLAAMTLSGSPTTGAAGAVSVDPDAATRFGSGSYGSATHASYAISGNVSVAAWTNATTTTNSRLIFKGGQSVGTLNYLLSWSMDGKDMRFLVDGNGVRYEAKATWPVGGGYHFVCGVYDGTYARLYLDGVEAAKIAASGALAVNTTPLTISASSPALTGSVDEAAVWNKALTAEQIAGFYALARQ